MHNDNVERLHSLDAVRAGALLLGIVLHGTMSFMPTLATMGWPIVDNSPSETLQTTFFVIHIFRMTAFFAIAGFFAHLLFHRRGAQAFIKDRSKRVLVPLLVGWLILMPVTTAIFVWALSRAGMPLTPPQRPDTLLAVPLMHLWFLYVLALLYVLVLGARSLTYKLFDGVAFGARTDAVLGWLIRSHLAPLVLALPVALSLAMRPGWGVYEGIPTPDQSLIPNLAAFVGYAVAFIFGWLLDRQRSLLSVLQRSWLAYALGAVLATVTIIALGIIKLPIGAGALAYAVASWIWTFALIGASMRFLSAHRPAVRYLADASYWMYLLHLPVVFGLQELMSEWPLHWSIKFPVLMIVTTALLLVTYRYFVRNTIIGETLNGRRYEPNVSAVASSPVAVESHLAALASLRGVKKQYGATVALDGVDLEIERGELLAVLGPNGAGKTTAISLLLGLEQADAGAVLLFGESPQSLEARRQTGVVMQEVALPAELRVRELLHLTSSYYAAPLTPDAVMQITHTSELAERPYGKLSGGQKRQVQFAMAICGRPQ
ncbi:MAG TPA: acyltransferase family protein, partial [Steroidobacteraceae bacterium]|nr:acyltransferase family protein [Steroidobacteraceae bacterium]